MTYWKNTTILLNIVGLDWLRCTFTTYSSLSIWLITYSRRWSSLTSSQIWLLSQSWIGRQRMSSTLRARRAKAHKGESLHPDGKQALPCCRSRYIVHNVWVFNAYWVTTGRIFEYHWRCQRFEFISQPCIERISCLHVTPLHGINFTLFICG